MDRGRIIQLLEPHWSRMTEILGASLSTDVALLRDVNGNVLSHGGKMLRPMLALLCAKVCGGINEMSVRIAAASEMLHNATLMHDDVADESKQRRGNPTVSSLLGPSAAVLVGDFWLARSVEMITSKSLDARIIKAFSKTLTDLAEGEMLQLEKARTADTEESDYLRIIYCKTASLFETAAVCAAISTDSDSIKETAIREYAKSLGIAFQIKDDILDYTGDETLGKPVGIDIREQKITLPLLGALKSSNREAEIRKMIASIHEEDEYANVVRNFVLGGKGVEYAAERLEGFVNSAIDALKIFPDSQAKDALIQLAEYNKLRTV